MLYTYAALAIIIFGSGFGLSHKIDQSEINSLHAAIERSNDESELTLKVVKDKVNKAEAEALAANQQLEQSHAQAINTINDYDRQLDNVRMYDHKARCPNTMPEDTNSPIYPGNEADGAELSAEFTSFLRSEAKRAELAAIDKNSLLEFINNNCGISRAE